MSRGAGRHGCSALLASSNPFCWVDGSPAKRTVSASPSLSRPISRARLAAGQLDPSHRHPTTRQVPGKRAAHDRVLLRGGRRCGLGRFGGGRRRLGWLGGADRQARQREHESERQCDRAHGAGPLPAAPGAVNHAVAPSPCTSDPLPVRCLGPVARAARVHIPSACAPDLAPHTASRDRRLEARDEIGAASGSRGGQRLAPGP